MLILPIRDDLELSEVTLIELGKVMRRKHTTQEDGKKSVILTGSYYEQKKLWHENMNIGVNDIANIISESETVTDLVNRFKGLFDLSMDDPYELGIRFDEICTVRFNRLLKFHAVMAETTFSGLSVESFINDYDELLSIMANHPDEYQRVKYALWGIYNTLKSYNEYDIAQDPDEVKIAECDMGEYFRCNAAEIASNVSEYKNQLGVNVSLMVLLKAYLYTDSIVHSRELEAFFESGEYIMPGTDLHAFLMEAYNSNRVFQNNKYATFINDIAYSENKLFEIYITYDNRFRVTTHYVS